MCLALRNSQLKGMTKKALKLRRGGGGQTRVGCPGERLFFLSTPTEISTRVRVVCGSLHRSSTWIPGALALLLVPLWGCGVREPVPPDRRRDARFGFLAGDAPPPPTALMCSRWMSVVVSRDPHAITHVTFPETNAQDACFVRVSHEGDDNARPASETPRGCSYPTPAARVRMIALAETLERVAATGQSHPLFACTLAERDRRAAAAHDARVLRAMAGDKGAYPYAAIVVPGHGGAAQSRSALNGFRPGDACRAIDGVTETALLRGMIPRTRRASALLRGGVAPFAIVSGAAVHSPLNESFAMLHLLTCPRDGASIVPAERVLLEPCADHTHTNVRNAGRWIHALSARNAYVITDDFLQAEYFQDSSGFELLMGSIDQRSLRDFAGLLGSWRQASIGNASGFWYTPYRFWAEPRDGLGTATCVDAE